MRGFVYSSLGGFISQNGASRHVGVNVTFTPAHTEEGKVFVVEARAVDTADGNLVTLGAQFYREELVQMRDDLNEILADVGDPDDDGGEPMPKIDPLHQFVSSCRSTGFGQLVPSGVPRWSVNDGR